MSALTGFKTIDNRMSEVMTRCIGMVITRCMGGVMTRCMGMVMARCMGTVRAKSTGGVMEYKKKIVKKLFLYLVSLTPRSNLKI